MRTAGPRPPSASHNLKNYLFGLSNDVRTPSIAERWKNVHDLI